MSPTRARAERRGRGLVATQTSAALVRTLLAIEGRPSTEDARLVRSWVTAELEARYPAVTAAMEAWVTDEGALGELSYTEALIAALPAEAVS